MTPQTLDAVTLLIALSHLVGTATMETQLAQIRMDHAIAYLWGSIT